MASNQVFKMAALLMLALFAGQLLMATPAMAGIGEATCLKYPAKCSIICFVEAYKKCMSTYFVEVCEGVAFGVCSGSCNA
jgi:hypothetical protein